MKEKLLIYGLKAMTYYLLIVLGLGMLTAIADTFSDRTIYKALLSLLYTVTLSN
jgi:hypothetical protein